MKKFLFLILCCLLPVCAFANAIAPGYIMQVYVSARAPSNLEYTESAAEAIFYLFKILLMLFKMNAFIAWIEWLVYKRTSVKLIPNLYWKVFFANVITSLFGIGVYFLFFGFEGWWEINSMLQWYSYFFACFVISFIFEYLILFDYSKDKLSKKQVLVSCIIANAVSYVLLTAFGGGISFLIGMGLFWLFFLHILLKVLIWAVRKILILMTKQDNRD